VSVCVVLAWIELDWVGLSLNCVQYAKDRDESCGRVSRMRHL